jgi:peptidoglycan biosynthesis protein MviN/MurJ (putative lipid II flippase)
LLSSGVLRTYCTVSGRPGLESRFGFVSVGVNVALTIPLLLTGAIGVASATCAGQVVGLIYLVRLVRSRLGPDVPNPMRSVPVLACLASAAVVVVIELLIRPLVPGGGLGLLACALPAPVGLVLYLSVVVGPRTLLTASRGFLGDVTRAGSRAAISHLVEQVGA